ncbi:MAG: hypothetical protein AAGD88_17620 [Bacteroidota bacterium]
MEKVEYYDNGDVKSRFVGDIKNGKGEKTFYEKNGVLKKKDFFTDSQMDSSVYYFEGDEKRIREIWSYDKNEIEVLRYNSKGQLTKRGKTLKKKSTFKIGKWKYSDHDTKMDSIVEYINLNGKSYPNQIWVMTSEGDTIYGRGNYFDIYKKDTVPVKEVARVQFILMEPSLNINSEVLIVVPKEDEKLNPDFSNIFEIERDTLFSMKNDGILRQNIPDETPVNHIVEFGIQFEKAGKRRIRGVLIEYFQSKNNDFKSDSLIERRLYFSDSILVN